MGTPQQNAQAQAHSKDAVRLSWEFLLLVVVLNAQRVSTPRA